MSVKSRLPRVHPIERTIELLLDQRRQIDLQVKELRALLPRQTRKPVDKPVKVKLSDGKVLMV